MVYNGKCKINSMCLGEVKGGHLCVDQCHGFMFSFSVSPSHLCTDISVRYSPKGTWCTVITVAHSLALIFLNLCFTL